MRLRLWMAVNVYFSLGVSDLFCQINMILQIKGATGKNIKAIKEKISRRRKKNI